MFFLRYTRMGIFIGIFKDLVQSKRAVLRAFLLFRGQVYHQRK